MDNNFILKHTYLVYGLIVQSQISLPELVVYDKEEVPDVIISCVKLRANIKNAIKEGKDHCFEKEQIWFSIKKVATYYVKDVNTIQVELFKGAEEQYVKTFLLGSALGMLLIKRNSIAIHGGSVVINEKGIILTGCSGSGKSTLTAALREKGYDFLADDVSVIGEDHQNNLMIMPGYPQQKLCSDAVEKFQYSDEHNIRKIDEDRNKYAIPITKKFRKEPCKLKAIYELSANDIEEVKVINITGMERLNIIFKNIFRFGLINYIGMDPSYLKKCIQIAKNVDVYKIMRPKEGYTIVEQIEIIETTVKGRYCSEKFMEKY
ncbi:hypothetical protein [Clostridium akagii]|uniref:hypothetical protein n=1 Tax=Clostridium akagii TaxID=91623 RepID=UPI00068C4229|nr:hypothetical protein [Clostridium akagii]